MFGKFIDETRRQILFICPCELTHYTYVKKSGPNVVTGIWS